MKKVLLVIAAVFVSQVASASTCSMDTKIGRATLSFEFGDTDIDSQLSIGGKSASAVRPCWVQALAPKRFNLRCPFALEGYRVETYVMGVTPTSVSKASMVIWQGDSVIGSHESNCQ